MTETEKQKIQDLMDQRALSPEYQKGYWDLLNDPEYYREHKERILAGMAPHTPPACMKAALDM